MFRLFVLTSVLACAFSATVPKGFAPRLGGRIAGGADTTIEEFPHQVSLNYEGQYFCGGSIISETVIVTAAHCLEGIPLFELYVYAGATRLAGKGVNIAVNQVIPHEHYNTYTMENDIALLILAEPLQFSDSIKPIDLAESGKDPKDGAVALVSGWGILGEEGDFPQILQYVAVNIINTEKCDEAYQKGGAHVFDSMICAGVPEGGKDACLGDSGGPLISGGKLVGIVSWGFDCADKKFPGVYARVSYLRDWIEKNRTDK